MFPLARNAGTWTILKLTFLKEYLNAYVEATKSLRRWSDVCFLDLFSGPGYVLNPKLLATPQGRPLYFLYFASDHPAGERIMSHILNKPRETLRQPEGRQLGFQFPEEAMLIPSLSDPWDFREGESWYDEFSSPLGH